MDDNLERYVEHKGYRKAEKVGVVKTKFRIEGEACKGSRQVKGIKYSLIPFLYCVILSSITIYCRF